jgi:hypoxanthine phosphoribosyltransferase
MSNGGKGANVPNWGFAMSRLKDDMIAYITKDEIDEMVESLAQQINQDYDGRDLVLVCPLKGSILFLADLCRHIIRPLQIDFVHFVAASKSEGNRVEINKDITVDIRGKHVLIIEEIIDTARTLSFLCEHLLSQRPASLRIVTLLDKPARRELPIKPHYVGRTIEDRYVVGYGLDSGELGRNYSQIYYLKH